MSNLRSALSISIIGFVVTILFGGWSVILLCAIVGALVGINYAQHSSKRTPGELGREALQPAAVASAVTVLGGVLHQLVIRPLIGESIISNYFLNFDWLPVGARPGQVILDSGLVLIINAVIGLAVGVGVAQFTASRMGLPERVRTQQYMLGLIAFLIILPFFEQTMNMNWLFAIIKIMIFSLLALGLNIVVGYAGLLDLGYAAFFAIGAYTTGLLSSPQIDVHWNFWLIIWVAAASAAVAGVVLGAPTLPLRGDYLALVTLGFGEIVPVLFRNLTAITLREPLTSLCLVGCLPTEARQFCLYACNGPLDLTAGERGINPIGRPMIPFAPENLFGANYLPWYFLVLVLIAFSIFFIRRMRDSRIGRAWMAIREDELAASQMGIDPVKTKLMAFAMGATFSGFAGAFYGSYISAIFPGVFDFSVSVTILCMVILGGLGNMVGVVVGGILIIGNDLLLLPQLAAVTKGIINNMIVPNVTNPSLRIFLTTSLDPSQMRFALFGIVLVVMMIVRPEGLIPSAQLKAELHEAESHTEVAA